MIEKKFAEKLFDIMNTRNLDEFMTKDNLFHTPRISPLRGIIIIKKFFRVLFRMYPELTFIIKEIIVDKDRAAVEWTNRGFHKHGNLF